jgi:hypothetical protein
MTRILQTAFHFTQDYNRGFPRKLDFCRSVIDTTSHLIDRLQSQLAAGAVVRGEHRFALNRASPKPPLVHVPLRGHEGGLGFGCRVFKRVLVFLVVLEALQTCSCHT